MDLNGLEDYSAIKIITEKLIEMNESLGRKIEYLMVK